jgi:hypothetical protein
MNKDDGSPNSNAGRIHKPKLEKSQEEPLPVGVVQSPTPTGPGGQKMRALPSAGNPPPRPQRPDQPSPQRPDGPVRPKPGFDRAAAPAKKYERISRSPDVGRVKGRDIEI